MTAVKDVEVARRIARTVVSDVTVYNLEKIEEGIRNDNLFEVMSSEIEEGRKYYKSRISPELVETDSLFNQALIDILVKSMGRISSKVW